jgi:hypothetical protein
VDLASLLIFVSAAAHTTAAPRHTNPGDEEKV